ncbi:ssRNA-binding protein [Cavenderia fasciculata]|uniref:SsRNA-binding protein n=1 Tax=Cavenderia fasciculata TaxID=261658 RepID=F4PZT5_CACFS|nr:ssRNA-binding protein [Cavenderia fasciculata]EGG18849.1 ssRNA-binding protein [Cavenderia fasciculata]|eukprot:XP_004357311.1 ssRNA-binding protein [Cavenderia fasciculata]
MSSETNELDEFYSALQSDDVTSTSTTAVEASSSTSEDKHGSKRKFDGEDNNNHNQNNTILHVNSKLKTGDTTTTSPSSSTSSSSSTTSTTTNKMIPSSLLKKKIIQKKPAATPSTTSTTSTTASVISSKAVTYSASTISKLQESNEVKLPSYVSQVMREKPMVTMEEPKKLKYTMGLGNDTWEDATLSEWNSNDYRLFVGQLGNEVTDEMLGQAFARYPSFEKAKVIREKKSQKTKGFGFVAFTSAADYIKAYKEMNGKYVGNRPLILKKSNWKERAVSTKPIVDTPPPTTPTGAPATLYQQPKPSMNKNSLYQKF